MKFSLAALTALVSMLGMSEGSTQSEVEDKILTDAAARKNSLDNDGTATKSEVEAFAAEIAALKAENASLKAGDADTTALDAANALVAKHAATISERDASIVALNAEVTALKADVTSLKAGAAGEHHVEPDEKPNTSNSNEVPSYMRDPLTKRAQKLHDSKK